MSFQGLIFDRPAETKYTRDVTNFPMNSLRFFLKYARYRYIAYRLLLRIKMGKTKRDEYLKNVRLSPIDYLPERSYVMNDGSKAIPRKGTRDFYMLFVSRERDIKPHLSMQEGETFIDVGANVGLYTLTVANEYKDKAVKVIAIEAHPENFRALCRNIQANEFGNVSAINKAVSDHKGMVTLYERSQDGTRADSDLYSLYNIYLAQNNIIHPNGKPLNLDCDTLDNMLTDQRADVIKIDIEGAEVLALKGATNTLKRLRKIIVEVHGDNYETVRNLLETSNFKLVMTEITGTVQHIIGSR
jgi:FkbM family methyltransferase